MGALADLLPDLPLRPLSELGVPPDAKEAVLWAVLAHESLFGEGFRPLHDPTAPPLALGKLSWPD